MEQMLIFFVVGLVAGAIRVLLGWIDSEEQFKREKIIGTLFSTSLSAAIAAIYFPIDTPLLVVFGSVLGGTYAIQDIGKCGKKIIYKKIK